MTLHNPRRVQRISKTSTIMICIPQNLVQTLNIKQGDYLDITIKDKKLVMEKISSK